MPLPKRDYFFFDEVIAKLQLSLRDIHYYICHGHLLTSVRVPHINFIQEAGGKKSTGVYRGYVTVDPDICFDLFCHGAVEARSFYHFYPATKLVIPETAAGIHLTEDSLLIAEWDFRAFTEIHDVPVIENRKPIGRPEKTDMYVMEYWRRVQSGAANGNNIAQISRELHIWGCKNFRPQDVPTANAIRNALTKARKQKEAELPTNNNSRQFNALV
jgi:hypothetical protein